MMDNKMIRDISVIIPTFNREKKIERAIQSVLNQSYPVKEIIIVDDCSSDHTEEVVKAIGSDKIRYYRLTENRGAGGARNYGVSMSKCSIIAFHDSDDVWLSQKIEKQMELLETQPDCGLVYSAYIMHLAYGIDHIVPQDDGTRNLSGDIFKDLLVRNSVGAPTVLMNKAIFVEVGGFDESMRSLEDWDFAIRVAEKYHIAFVPDVLLDVERSEGGVSANQAAYYQCRCLMVRKYRKQLLETGLFENVVSDILKQAVENGIASQVEQILVRYLS